MIGVDFVLLVGDELGVHGSYKGCFVYIVVEVKVRIVTFDSEYFAKVYVCRCLRTSTLDQHGKRPNTKVGQRCTNASPSNGMMVT